MLTQETMAHHDIMPQTGLSNMLVSKLTVGQCEDLQGTHVQKGLPVHDTYVHVDIARI